MFKLKLIFIQFEIIKYLKMTLYIQIIRSFASTIKSLIKQITRPSNLNQEIDEEKNNRDFNLMV